LVQVEQEINLAQWLAMEAIAFLVHCFLLAVAVVEFLVLALVLLMMVLLVVLAVVQEIQVVLVVLVVLAMLEDLLQLKVMLAVLWVEQQPTAVEVVLAQ
jgi:hypothetical protein